MRNEHVDRPGPVRALIGVAFFLSGFAALVYEVAWLRLAGLYFESTALSAATTVALFMAGLALGSAIAGRVIRGRRDLILVYLNLEALVALMAILVPFAFTAVRPVFGWVYQSIGDQPVLYHAARLLLSAVLILPVTTAMGLTLPVLVEALTRRLRDLGTSTGVLYGVNCAGAAAGAAAAGLILLPAVGTLRTTWIGAAVNLGIALGGWALLRTPPWGRRMASAAAAPLVEPAPATAPPVGQATRPTVLAAYAVAGFSMLCYEIVWTRVLIATIGPASTSFAVVLCCFILGLALGSLLYAAVAHRVRDQVAWCGGILLGAAVAAVGTTLVLQRLPELSARLISATQGDVVALTGARYLLAAIVLLPTTIFAGAMLPAAAAAYVRDPRRLALHVGRLYAANSVGSIAGSLVAGFILLPWLGATRAVIPAVALQLIAAVELLRRERGWRPLRLALPVAGLAAAVLMLAPASDAQRLFGGSYLYFERFLGGADDGQRLLYHRDGPGGTVTVTQTLGTPGRFFAIDGKVDGSTNPPDMATQMMAAHLPLLAVKDPREVLIIGLGTGASLASALRHPVERATCVELSPQVIEAAAYFNDALGGDPLDDPRAELVVGDGRSYVFFSPRMFDVVISEPSNPWMSGVGNLFTREYFEAIRGRLTSGGVACQWLQGYRLDEDAFRCAVRTFTEVFPYASLWWVDLRGGDFLLLGSDEPHRFDLAHLERELPLRGVDEYFRPGRNLDPLRLMRRFILAEDGLRAWSAAAPVNTDDNAVLEYAAGRAMYSDSLRDIYLHLAERAQAPTAVVDVDADAAARLARYREALLVYHQSMREVEPGSSMLVTMRDPRLEDDADIAAAFASHLLRRGHKLTGRAMAERGEVARRMAAGRAVALLQATLGLEPAQPEAYPLLATAHRLLGDAAAMRAAIDDGLQRGQSSAFLYRIDGEALYGLARAEAAGAAQLARAGRRDEAAAAQQRARALLDRACASFERAIELEPLDVLPMVNAGILHLELGRTAAARTLFERALELDPDNEVARRSLVEAGGG